MGRERPGTLCTVELSSSAVSEPFANSDGLAAVVQAGGYHCAKAESTREVQVWLLDSLNMLSVVMRA